jgi:hypothetical protein
MIKTLAALFFILSFAAIIVALKTKFDDRTALELTRPLREIELPGFSERYPLLGISVPDSFTYERAEGPDFMVHYLTSGSKDCTICIYTGSNSREKQPPAADDKIGVVGCREVTWNHKSLEGKIIAFTQINMFLNPKPDYKGVFRLCGHRTDITLTAKSARDLDALKSFCTTLRVIHPGLVQNAS